MSFNFNRAAEVEDIVFGAERPGYSAVSMGDKEVQTWIQFMKGNGIKRVCCLLSQKQLDECHTDLLKAYRKDFGRRNVCWAPVEDFHLAELNTLKDRILPFLKESDVNKERVVVHCAGGLGRTGHVLAAWLVHGRHFEIEKALSAVISMGRNPMEAVDCRKATKDELYELLRRCR